MAKATQQAAGDTVVEYQVWFDAPDGVRRSANAVDPAGVQQILVDLEADENRRQVLAENVGLIIEPHAYNAVVTEITTSTKQVTP
jgi:hypothetical protein